MGPEVENTRLWDKIAVQYDQLVSKFFGETYAVITENLQRDVVQSKNLLDAATGTGILAVALSQQVAHITGIDLSPEMIKLAREKAGKLQINNIDFLVGDICNLEFENKKFETVIAANVLHFLSAPDIALQEMSRVLEDNGQIIVPTFCHGENWRSKLLSVGLMLLGQKPRNWWSVKGFLQFVENNGYKIKKNVYIKGKIPLVYVAAKKMDPIMPPMSFRPAN